MFYVHMHALLFAAAKLGCMQIRIRFAVFKA